MESTVTFLPQPDLTKIQVKMIALIDLFFTITFPIDLLGFALAYYIIIAFFTCQYTFDGIL